jgi:hypothetical protein
MFGATLITAITPNVTIGHIGDHLLLHEFFNAYNTILVPAGAAGSVIADALADAHAEGYGTVMLMGDSYTIGGGVGTVALDISLPTVNLDLNGATIFYTGDGVCLQFRMDPFTVDQAGHVRNGTIDGSGAGDGAIGVYSGDVIAAEFDDLVIQGFNGAGSLGLVLDNVTNWTELNKFRRVRIDDCTVCIRCSVSGGNNSFARNVWDIHFNLHASQIGFQATDNALLYAQHGFWDGNAIGNDAVFIDMLDSAAISGHVDVEFERTGAFTGVIGLREASVSFQWYCSGTHNYSESITPDRAGGWDLLSLPLGLRIREGAANARMGAVTLVGGTATVNTTAIKDASAGQRVWLTRQAGAFNSPRGHLEVGTRTDGVSFVINATSSVDGSLVADVSVVSWLIIDNWDS